MNIKNQQYYKSIAQFLKSLRSLGRPMSNVHIYLLLLSYTITYYLFYYLNLFTIYNGANNINKHKNSQRKNSFEKNKSQFFDNFNIFDKKNPGGFINQKSKG